MPESPSRPVAPYNPIESSQNWQTEPGLIDSFDHPNTSPVESALHHGAVGLGAGAIGGSLTGRNPWLTGANTAIGATVGNVLTSLLTKNMTDAGARSAYTTLGSALGGGAGLGLSTFMQDKRDKNKHMDFNVPLPGARINLTTKKAAFNDVVRSIGSQLPNIRGFDTALGGAVGAAGGLGYDALTSDESASPKEKRRARWSHVLSGAGIGALGANVVGDRTRRYVTNKIYPVGYNSSAKHVSVKPSSFKDVWQGAILDKPLQPEVQQYQSGNYGAPYKVPQGAVATPRELTARRELLRRDFGVHTETPKSDMWLTQPDGSVSLNPQHPDVVNSLKEFYYPSDEAGLGEEGDGNFSRLKLMTNPSELASKVNSTGVPGVHGLMSGITGGQRISDYPYARTQGNQEHQDHLLKMQDQWNFRLHSDEQKKFMDYLKARYIHGNDKAELIPGNETYSTGDLSIDKAQVTKDTANSYRDRLVLEHLLGQKAPWISQRMYMHKLPVNEANPTADTGYAGIPSTASGQIYPGKSISTYAPVKPDGSEWGDEPDPYLNMHSPEDILPKLHDGSYVPNVRKQQRQP